MWAVADGVIGEVVADAAPRQSWHVRALPAGEVTDIIAVDENISSCEICPVAAPGSDARTT